MKLKNFIGIDVSKKHLDIVVVIDQNEVHYSRFENSKKAWKKKIKELKQEFKLNLTESLFCLESTGNYSNPSLYTLYELGANVWLELPIHIKRSQGFQRGKSDPLDAARIAWYAHDFHRKARLWQPPSVGVEKLKQLSALRLKLIRSKNQYQSPNRDLDFINDKEMLQIIKKTNESIINTLKKKIKSIDEKIKGIIESDNALKSKYEIVLSVPGVGWITAVDFLVNTNEFKSIKCPRKYACYAGVAPFENSSGSIRKGSHVSHFANKEAKRLLHLAAMSAVVMKGELQDYYFRKQTQGKTKMTALNAVRNKIIHRVFACVKRNEKYVLMN